MINPRFSHHTTLRKGKVLAKLLAKSPPAPFLLMPF